MLDDENISEGVVLMSRPLVCCCSDVSPTCVLLFMQERKAESYLDQSSQKQSSDKQRQKRIQRMKH
jgi:hypothetical protein